MEAIDAIIVFFFLRKLL